MTIKERIELGKLGYTKDEIKEIIESEKTAAQVQPAEVEQAVQEPEQQTVNTADILKAINDLTQTIQANNIKNSVLSAEPEQSVQDILANIVNKK